MKKSTYFIAVVVTFLLVLSQVTINAQTLVSDWGTTPRGSSGWTILNTAATPAGTGSMGGAEKPSGWMSIKGGFAPLTATTSQAFVITGTFEFVGGGANNAYTWLRYALFNMDGELSNKNTPTAAWSETSNGNGYIFTPVTGVGTVSNTYNTWPSGNQGTNWPLVNSKGWTSTNSNGGGPFGTVLQAPNRQVAVAGVYDWAISVQPLADGTNEVRWYFIQQHAANSQNYYWWGGSFIDKTPGTTKFNSIGFACNNDLDATTKQVNLKDVKVSLGSPITIPAAPWQAFYVEDWGTTPRGSSGWTILNTADYVIGNAAMGGTEKPSGWMSIKGGFNPVKLVPGKAFKITGKFEFVGGGANNAYTWLRYALFNMDGALVDKNKPTANWTETSNGNGYIFTPVTGVGTVSNTYNTWPTGNQGTNWPLINSKSWTSTNSNGGGPFGTVMQAPNRQVATTGVYDFAISVERLANGTQEVRWYFIQQHAANSQNYYWWGGSFIDTAPTTDVFNSIGFACNNDLDATCKQVNLTDVKVDMGPAITIPTAPWQAFYVEDWGTTPRGSNGWTILNTADYVIGNASMGGTGKPTGWMSIKGGFLPVTLIKGKAFKVTGKFEFVGGGGGSNYTWLRYALFNMDGALVDKNKPTANWTETSNGDGYIFTPVTGVGTVSNTYNTWPTGNQGTNWPLINSKSWTSTNSNGGGPFGTVMQIPLRQVAVAGVYDFAISVQPLADGTNEVRWYFIQQHAANATSYYWWGGSFIDKTPTVTKINSIGFALNSDVDAGLKQVNLLDVKVDMGDPIVVPEAPWQKFYVDTWGILGQRRGGGWMVKPQDVIGNVTIQGENPADDFVVLRGQFPGGVTPTSKALLISAKVEFVGGGFEPWGSLRYGLFYGDAGKVDSSKNLYTWTGAEDKHSGYLFFPPSGTKDLAYWVAANKTGSFGGVFNTIPIYNFGPQDYPVGTANTSSTKVMSKPGLYDLKISIAPQADGTAEIRHLLISNDKKYYWADKAIDKAGTRASKIFNSFVLALGKTNSTTGVKITDFLVDMGNPITLPVDTDVNENIEGAVPTEFALEQNFPNPFNPSTTISFALPQNSNVKLVVYDVLGKVVAELIDGNMNAGFHKVNFNASNLSSGVYFYSIKAGEFSSVKKLLLMK